MGERDYKGLRGFWEGDKHIHYLDCDGGFKGYKEVSKLFTFTLNLCSLSVWSREGEA